MAAHADETKPRLSTGPHPAASILPAATPLAPNLRAAIRAGVGGEGAVSPALVTLEMTAGQADPQPPAGARRAMLATFFTARRSPSRDDWLRVVQALSPGATLRLAGAEPLDSPHFEAVLFAADGRGLQVEVITKGSGLEQAAPVLYGLGVSVVRLVLPYPREPHGGVDGYPPAFERAITGILALRGLRYGVARPCLVLHLVASDNAAERAAEMVEYALAVGADRVVLQHRWFDAGGARSLPEELVSCIRDTRRSGLVTLMPPLNLQGVGNAHVPSSVPDARCAVAWRSVTVGCDGLARFCGDEVLGDIRTNALEEIFNGERARAFRRRLRKELLPECARCRARFALSDPIV
jgi:hypothetical protein